MKSKKNIEEMLLFEKSRWEKGEELIAGIDEVGRGSLAGPMVVAAVILNPKHLKEYKNLPNELSWYHKINDSKALSHKLRCEISSLLHNELISYSLVEVAPKMIDEKGLTYCTKYAFSKAIRNLQIKPDHVMTDAFEAEDIDKSSQTNLIGGDSRSISIAAASIIAKVHRDNLMGYYHRTFEKYQMYGFDKHKGYGTKHHLDAIRQHGLSDIHRVSYKLHL